MNWKSLLGGVLGHHMMRHRQHRRFLGNALGHARRFGPGRSLLLMGGIALAGKYLQKRRAKNARPELPQTGSIY